MKTLAPLLFVLVAAQVPVSGQFALQPRWSVPPLVQPYLGTNNAERGMAYNPVSGNVLVASRFGASPSIHVLDGNTGVDRGTLAVPTSIVTGGTFALNMLGIGADGAIYGANLITASSNAATPLKIYRWANESATPTVAYAGNPSPGNNQRYGDTLDVRGSGAGTQILLGSRNGTNAVLLTTVNGADFTASPINASGISGGDFGLGIAFGAGDTFWGKGSAATTLRYMNLSGGVPVQSYATSAFTNTFNPIGVDPTRSLLAAISIATPDRVLLYNIANSLSSSNAPVLLDTLIFPTDFPNGNGVGSIDFGGDILFVLDTNNGLQAYTLIPEPPPALLAMLGVAVFWGARRLRRDDRANSVTSP